MSITVKAPRLGEGVNELTIGRWLVEVGAVVEENTPLVELESDKVVTELASPAAGILLKTFVREGDVVRVGDAVALIARKGEADDGAPEPPASDAANPQTAVASAARVSADRRGEGERPFLGAHGDEGEPKLFLSPLARKLCALHEVDPRTVRGTGLGGRVMKQDILDFVAARAQAAPLSEVQPEPTPPTGTLRPHSNARARIAVRMVESMRASAQVLTVMEADLGAVMAHRAANKESFARGGLKLTLTAYFLAAAAAALRRHPTVNSSWSDEGLLIHPTVDIGMAVSLGEEGLLVPVIRKADTLSLEELSRAVEDLAARSRSRKLTPDEVRGGTFSLTNHGSSGSLFATPILVQGQSGILGVGMVQKRAVVVETPTGADAIAIRPMAYLSFVFDHRVMDGEGADRFLADVKRGLENWR
jgi:2-oxoglutarate dehydrogenase E2 component (dihydrolipoamide succinyltransferase)